MRNPLRPLYNWTLAQAEKPRAEPLLYFISFIESIFFPIPPDLVLVPLTLARPKQWVRLAGLCTLFSVLGGATGYALGFFLFDQFGEGLLTYLHATEAFERFKLWYESYAGLAVFAGAISPIPYKVVALASGSVAMSFLVFVGISLVARALRFFLVAGLIAALGERAKVWIDRWFGPLSILGVVLLALLIYLLVH